MIVIVEAILSTVADASESRREYGETSPFSSFHCFARLPSRAWHEIGANGRAREFRSFAAVLIFFQQQMFFPQDYARVYEVARMYILFSSLFYSLQKFISAHTTP